MDTKACNLTEDEIFNLIVHTGNKLSWPNANVNDLMERLNYPHKRLKAFGDKEETEAKPAQSQPQPSTAGFSTQGFQ